MEHKQRIKKYEFIVNTSNEFMTMIDREHRYVEANQAYCQAHNRTLDQVLGKTISEMWGEEKTVIIRKFVDECFKGHEVNYESWFEFPALGRRCFEVYCYPFNEGEETTHIVVVSRDITERKELQHKVFVDPLTNMFNYRYMSQRLEEEFERARRYNLDLSMLFADIDHFKKINDLLGHQVGNEVLTHIAHIFGNATQPSFGNTARLRKADIIARFGGEEFVVLLPETGKSDAEAIGERIRATVEGYAFPHLDKTPEARITISIGVAAVPLDNIQNAGELIKKADLAMYEAKNLGRNRVSLYTD
ncbi:MAG: GGDEF domain-containing protein [bacterium]|nr:GGDEF domain-containing protein [bacterium]